MQDAIKIYKNSKSFDYVIMLEMSEDKVDKVVKDQSIVQLFNQDQLVGLNIFDSSLFNDHKDGFIYPESKVLETLNTYLQNNGFDLSFVYNKADYLKVAKVLEVNKVKGSDNLTLCKVSVGDSEYSMICGAKNVKEGMKTIAALDNALLYDGSKISKGEVLGVFSDGMLCSLKELGLDPNQKHSGIVELDQDEVVGKSFFDVDWRKYNV
ncbi:MAG: hypothetical protein GX769_04865 [Erysipelothrix sp.]|nr:hypothetical protein [Erysipelothrix sp.]